VRRVLLSPRWLLGHALVVIAAVGFCRLGWWQLSVWEAPRGSFQNLGYALQWPLFAVFGVAMWVRIVRDTADPVRAAARAEQRAAAQAERRARSAARIPGPTGSSPAAALEGDDELAAYNRYLAGLYERDRREQG
jgi:DNA-binding transcriptional regulator of glucitol operon